MRASCSKAVRQTPREQHRITPACSTLAELVLVQCRMQHLQLDGGRQGRGGKTSHNPPQGPTKGRTSSKLPMMISRSSWQVDSSLPDKATQAALPKETMSCSCRTEPLSKQGNFGMVQRKEGWVAVPCKVSGPLSSMMLAVLLYVLRTYEGMTVRAAKLLVA